MTGPDARNPVLRLRRARTILVQQTFSLDLSGAPDHLQLILPWALNAFCGPIYRVKVDMDTFAVCQEPASGVRNKVRPAYRNSARG